jgi:hypothetical protein
MSTTSDLLLEIGRCPNVPSSLDRLKPGHPCAIVVSAQGLPADEMHVPEPWSGHIESAPLLFVSWNPSWNPRERFPTRSWADDAIVDFFQTRFTHTDQASQTWREMRGIAEHLLGRRPTPGVDYCVTDAVRCKSQRGRGAREALAECAGRYLRRTLDVSGARVIVALGRDARMTLAEHLGTPADIGVHCPVGGPRDRLLVMLGAPGSSQPRRLEPAECRRVRAALSGA